MFDKVVLLSKKIKIAIIAIVFILVSSLLYCNYFYGCKRLKFIIDIPVTAFDENGRLVNDSWIKFLSYYKPIGVIFFADHLRDKNIAKQMISDIKSVIGEEKLFIAADEEGGRVNRMNWVDIMSASEVAERYAQIKATENVEAARMFVEQEYSKMFQEMQDIGLNLDFAPNLDVNIYENLENSIEYRYYKQAEKYVRMARKRRNKLLSDKDRLEYAKTMMFYAYLDEIGAKSLDNFSIDGKISDDTSIIEMIREQWKNLNETQKYIFVKDFRHIAKYANYASVVGDRSYGKDIHLIAEIASIFVKTAKKYGVKCTIKHILGHGRTLGDTHNGTEYVDATIDTILHDLYPYKMLIKDVNFVMPADIIYKSVDDKRSAMNSDKVLNFFRKHVGNAVFIGDDISVRNNITVKQKCDIHIKVHNQSVDDILQFINNDDYVGQGIWKRWFR